MTPKVSIIVPVFRPGPYVTSCFDSLAAQTLEGVEVIFVDDCGGDGSIGIIAERIARCSGPVEFSIISNPKNLGPGMSRNVGLKAARGEYVCFVDSDDSVDKDFSSVLYGTAVNSGADIACCDISVGGVRRRNPDVRDKSYFLRHYVSYFTTFIYRKSFIEGNGIVFPDSCCAEDACFLACAVLASGSMAQVDREMYFYNVHDGSLSRKWDPKRAAQRIHSFKLLKSFASSRGYDRTYGRELKSIMLKKCYGMAVRDLLHL